MSRIRRIAPGLGRGGLLGNTEGPEAYLRELDTLPSQFCRATGGTETVIEEGDEAVSLLLNFDGSNGSTTFTDQSIYAHTVTANGGAAISTTESKFGGSSAAFDGSGDYLSVAPASPIELGSGDYTIECWINISAAAANGGIISKGPVSGLTNTTWSIEFNGAANTLSVYIYNANSSGYIINGTTNVKTSTWTHVALTRSGNNTRFFINGTQEGSTYTSPYTISAGDNLYMGGGFYAPSTRSITGYIDSLRIVKGKALFTGNFTPPASAPTNKTGKYYRVHTFTDTDPTSLLLNFDGSNGSTTFTDDSGWGHAVTANGDAQISTTQSVFGGSSAAFDGTGDYLTVSDSLPLRLESGDFTLEGWVYLTSSVDNVGFVAKRQPAAFSGTDWRISYRSASGKFSWDDPSSAELFTPAVSLNTWVHIAFVRIGTTLYCYANGVLGDTGTVSSNFTNTNALTIGRNTAGLEFPGYIDSLRIVKGQALYTAAFTPSTTALTRVGSGSLTFTRGGAVEYLVVGGGGGGGGAYPAYTSGGGGGGGEVREGAAVFVGANAISVGGGGVGGVGIPSAGYSAPGSGADSQLGTATALGGGSGGVWTVDPETGGSGGGAANQIAANADKASGAAAGIGQASDGGDGFVGTNNASAGGGGGGGGAGAAGDDYSGLNGGSGGAGVVASLDSVTYGGGGGGAAVNGTAGSGGSGGGGAGSSGVGNGTSGIANTGGGGGGAGAGNTGGGRTGGAGGSGIVIARYRITQAEYEAEAA